MNVQVLNAALHANELHYRLLKVLESDPGISQRELAGRLGISLGKVNYCLQALIGKGWLKVRNFANSERKRAYTYYLTKKGLQQKARVTVEFIRWKMTEFEALQSEIEALYREHRLSENDSGGHTSSVIKRGLPQ